MIKNSKKGFSLVELLSIIVIVGIIITISIIAITKTIDSSRKNSLSLQEKLLKETTKTYIQENKDKAPKVVGESVNISLKELKDKKYLTEDIYNSSKESCMKDSYVRVYKLNNKELTYLPLIYCGNERKSELDIPIPTVKTIFTNNNDEEDSDLIFTDLDKSKLNIKLTGGKTKGKSKIELYSYQMIISLRTKSDPILKDYYDSGVVYLNNKYNYTINNKITDYINSSNITSINVTVIVTNSVGGYREVTTIAQSNINKETNI